MQIKIDINVCRVCLKSDGANTQLFDASSGQDYASKFTYTTQLKVKTRAIIKPLRCSPSCTAFAFFGCVWRRFCLKKFCRFLFHGLDFEMRKSTAKIEKSYYIIQRKGMFVFKCVFGYFRQGKAMASLNCYAANV